MFSDSSMDYSYGGEEHHHHSRNDEPDLSRPFGMDLSVGLPNSNRSSVVSQVSNF